MTYSGNCRLGDVFKNRREKGRPGLPTLSVTINDGIVNRDDLDRKQETNLTPQQHLLAKPNDIAYNMMRMWQGAFGLVRHEGLVSPAYVVLSPKKNVDPLFASYYFKSPRAIYLFWAYSHGLTEDRLRLYYDDFSRIPATLPSISRQRTVAKLLEAWDRGLEIAKRLLAASKKQKLALMQQLLYPAIGKVRESNGWLDVRLEALFSERSEMGFQNLPLLSITKDGGVLLRSELSDKDVSSVDKSKYRRICPGDIGYNTMRMWQGISAFSSVEGIVSPAYTIVTPNERIDGHFAAQLFKFDPVVFQFYRYSQGLVSDTWNLNFRDFSLIKLRIPDIDEQLRIVRTLDSADSVIANLDTLVGHLEVEKRSLMQRLLHDAEAPNLKSADGK